mmetsp:Transcript_16549/g.49342  ORF Transcript_16549/g.49342 Transcript_16549/m.49342 type:complete len:84 (+) Transcript_16549:1587-1838(+)
MPRFLIIDDGWQITKLDGEDSPRQQMDSKPSFIAAILSAIRDLIMGVLNWVFKQFYENIVYPAAPGSWSVRFFTWLAAGMAAF